MMGASEMGMTRESFSVLIPDGESEFALFAAHCLAPFPNVKVYALSGGCGTPTRFSRCCHTYTYKQTEPGDRSRLEAVADIVKKNKIDVLLPTGTQGISFVVSNRQALSGFVAIPPLPDPKSFGIANNKWQLAQFLQENQIPCPPTILLTCDELFEAKIQTLEFPVLLKPVAAWGGEGIEHFEDLHSLKRYLARQDPDKMKGQFIVQSFLPGFVVGVNILSSTGKILAATMQRGIIPNTQKYAAAGGIRFIKEDRFLAIAQKLISALGYSGFANLDTLCDSRDDQLEILEINARFWGSLRGSLVAGVSFPYLACLAGLGIPFPVPDYELVYYIHSETALRHKTVRLFRPNSERNFALHETGWRFFRADPLAESLRAFRQKIQN